MKRKRRKNYELQGVSTGKDTNPVAVGDEDLREQNREDEEVL